MFLVISSIVPGYHITFSPSVACLPTLIYNKKTDILTDDFHMRKRREFFVPSFNATFTMSLQEIPINMTLFPEAAHTWWHPSQPSPLGLPSGALTQLMFMSLLPLLSVLQGYFIPPGHSYSLFHLNSKYANGYYSQNYKTPEILL